MERLCKLPGFLETIPAPTQRSGELTEHLPRSAVSLISAVYAIRSYRRLSALDELTYSNNAKPYGFNSEPDPEGGSYASRLSLITPSHRGSIHSAHSAQSGGNRPERRRSSGSMYSAVSRGGSEPLSGSTKSPSVYNHERDTLFDEYSSRQKAAQLREHVERVLGGGGSPPARVSSYGGRPLGAVQEEAEEEEHEHRGRAARNTVDSDQMALLGRHEAREEVEEREGAAVYSDEVARGGVELEDLRGRNGHVGGRS
jgi:hypothetical protein